jgi:uncharacterized membrane protein YgaE (UPF0421/DUF939 family)
MLTLKQRAAFEVAKTLVVAIVIGTGTGILLNTIPLAIVGIGACIIMLAYFLKMVYDAKLSELEAEEKLKS